MFADECRPRAEFLGYHRAQKNTHSRISVEILSGSRWLVARMNCLASASRSNL